jgi:hypothetical protein
MNPNEALTESLTPDESREWMDRRYPDTNPFCDRFGHISVVYKCGHKFGLKHWDPERVTQEVHDEWVAHALTRICDDCYTKATYPLFTLALDARTFDVEGAYDIHTALQQRKYRYRGYGAWVRRFESKKAAATELAWIRKRGYNVQALVKHCGDRRYVDLKTDELRDTLAAENASYERTRKAMHPSPPRAPKVSDCRAVIDTLRSLEDGSK